MNTLREAADRLLDVCSDRLPISAINAIIDELNNLRAALAEPTCKDDLHVEPVQEPVAWLSPRTVDSYMRPDLGYETCSKTDYGAFPVYTHPAPQRQPLTEYEAWEIWDALADRGKKGEDIVHAFARAIERAHGIGGQDDTR